MEKKKKGKKRRRKLAPSKLTRHGQVALTLLITVSVHRKKNSKVTQKKKTRNHRSSKFYTHTHSNLKIFSRVITKPNHLFRL